MFAMLLTSLNLVHGDIRHLEIRRRLLEFDCQVHGDIRHLEIVSIRQLYVIIVHGDIRHLENALQS